MRRKYQMKRRSSGRWSGQCTELAHTDVRDADLLWDSKTGPVLMIQF